MAWSLSLAVVIVAAILAIWFLNHFYRKANRETALVRTGFGGKRVILDGACLVLPFLHRVAEVNMKTSRLEIRREGRSSLITQDRLRVDMAVEFYLRVRPDTEGVAIAAQALGGKTFRVAELQEVLQGKLIGAIQGVVARFALDELHENRLEFVNQVKQAVADGIARNGLELESASLTQLDQTPFHALDENNAFNAVGMRRLAEIIAANKKQRAAIEADAEVAVRQSQLEASKRRLAIEREEQEAQILKDQQTRAAEIDKDRRLRELQLNTQLTLEIAESQNQIDLSRKAAEVAQAQAEADQTRAGAAAAAQAVQTEKDKAAAERARQVALIRAKEQAEVEHERSHSAAARLRNQAEAEAAAQTLRAKAKQAELQAEAAGRKALAEADNALSEAVLQMRLERHKFDALPEIIAQMVKPAEKIDSIRINQISGLPGIGADAGGSGKAPVNQAIAGLLGMAVQLPVLQKLGEELGLNFADKPRPPTKSEPSGDES